MPRFALLHRIMFIDSHVHFDRFVKDGTFAELLSHAEEAGVLEMFTPGSSMKQIIEWVHANIHSRRLD